MTSTKRNIPFHVKITKGLKINGFIMVEQVKSVDFFARNIKYIKAAPPLVVNEVLAILDACIY